VSTPLGIQELRDAARAVVARFTGIFWPGATVENGTLIPPPGDPAQTHVHYVSEFASFSAAVTALAAFGNHQHLIVPTLQTLTAAVDVPNTITIQCVGVGGFSGAFDLTLRGGFVSEPVQRFQGSINVKFVQADSSANTLLGEVYAEWWGAQGNDSTNDTAAFNSALSAIKTSRGMALRLLARPYRASITVPAPSNAAFPVVILGSGDGSAIRTTSASSPAISLDLGVSDPNTTLLFRDFYLNGRGSQSVPVLSLKAQAGTGNRFFGVLDNLKVVGSGSLSDCIYMKGGLAVDINVRTEEGRYALYLEESSNTVVRLHAGANTCNGIMVKGGGNVSVLRARIEDSIVANTRAVNSISKSGSTITVVTATAHNMETMDRVTLSGVTGTNYNFTSPRSVTVVNSTTFTYESVSETGAASGGTVRISSSALRIKNSSFGEYRNIANEGKTGLDYGLWIQSDGTTATGDPSCTHNTFSGCEFAAPAATTRDNLATVLLEGPCIGNESFGTTFGKASGINANSWEFLLQGNASGVRPRLNRFRGHVYLGSGSTGTIRYSEPIEGAYGNRVELTEKSGQKTYRKGHGRNVTSSTAIDELHAGQTIYTSGAGATVVITMFAAQDGLEPTRFVNNSAQLLGIDPNGTETIGTGGAGKYLELAAGASVVVGCTVTGKLDILASAGALTYEP
jgi:hypothetical protein